MRKSLLRTMMATVVIGAVMTVSSVWAGVDKMKTVSSAVASELGGTITDKADDLDSSWIFDGTTEKGYSDDNIEISYSNLGDEVDKIKKSGVMFNSTDTVYEHGFYIKSASDTSLDIKVKKAGTLYIDYACDGSNRMAGVVYDETSYDTGKTGANDKGIQSYFDISANETGTYSIKHSATSGEDKHVYVYAVGFVAYAEKADGVITVNSDTAKATVTAVNDDTNEAIDLTNSVAGGTKVKLTINPDVKYLIDSITDSANASAALDGYTYSFTVDGNRTISITYKDNDFTVDYDVADGLTLDANNALTFGSGYTFDVSTDGKTGVMAPVNPPVYLSDGTTVTTFTKGAVPAGSSSNTSSNIMTLDIKAGDFVGIYFTISDGKFGNTVQTKKGYLKIDKIEDETATNVYTDAFEEQKKGNYAYYAEFTAEEDGKYKVYSDQNRLVVFGVNYTPAAASIVIQNANSTANASAVSYDGKYYAVAVISADDADDTTKSTVVLAAGGQVLATTGTVYSAVEFDQEYTAESFGGAKGDYLYAAEVTGVGEATDAMDKINHIMVTVE